MLFDLEGCFFGVSNDGRRFMNFVFSGRVMMECDLGGEVGFSGCCSLGC